MRAWASPCGRCAAWARWAALGGDSNDERHRELRSRRARVPQRPGAGAAARSRRATSAPCWARSATSRTAPCCTPTRAAARAARPGPRGTTRAAARRRREPHVCVHYLINSCSRCRSTRPVIVSLNPVREPRPDRVLANSLTAIRSSTTPPSTRSARFPRAGRAQQWFAGAWTGYGFHEDGLKSGLRRRHR